MMRVVHAVLFVAMLGFIAVQYNDPDGPLWMLIYTVPAIWACLAAFRPAVVRSGGARRWLLLSLALGLAGVIFYFPQMPNFWLKEVYWVEETAREGMGVMIGFAVMLLVYLTSRGGVRDAPASQQRRQGLPTAN